MKNIRINEYKVLLYRLFLSYIFFSVSRLLFVLFNYQFLHIQSKTQLFWLCIYGLRFDTTIILYLNSLFIVFSLLPVKSIVSKKIQKWVFYVYFIPNALGIALNFVDLIYFKFKTSRSTMNILESVEHETNKSRLFLSFIIDYWYVFLLFFITIAVWVVLYKSVKLSTNQFDYNRKRIIYSFLFFLLAIFLSIVGIRGDFKKSTRPLNIIDASNYVKDLNQTNVILNTPFCIVRTISNSSFKKLHFVSEETINSEIKPLKQYPSKGFKKMNVVIFIMESFGREYLGVFNKENHIKNYVSYTPFLDSLSNHSMIYTNGYSNGVGSIHAPPSILSGIPSFKDSFTTSPYLNTKIESLVSILNSEGYDTSFFHGAPNGSMGFLGFCNILGYQHYYGMTEYNNDKDFDGWWGIWDEPFFHYMKNIISEKKKPFLATVFSVSSHAPFEIPQEYKQKFKEGNVPLHRCIRYSDYSLKRFFEEASKETWFNNTLFVLTGDHCNQIYYDEYFKTLNRTAVPIILYMPGNPNFKGVDKDWAQHIDIYPTILDILGYNKLFRSWGRSLLRKDDVKPFAINYLNNQYQFMYGDYVCTFDGEKVTGYYFKTDKNYTKNLIGQNRKEFKKMDTMCKAFIQNYFQKIMDKDLTRK